MISISSRPDRKPPPLAGVVQPRRFHGGSSDSTDLPGESFQGRCLETEAPRGVKPRDALEVER